jgi:hypothetical protein
MPREWENDRESLEELENSAEETPPAPRRMAGRARLRSNKKIPGRFGKYMFDTDKFFWGLLILALLFSGYDLSKRLSVEWRHRTVGIAVEYRDIVLLSRQTGESPEAIFGRMRERGAEGIAVSELTGKDLAAGFLPVYYGSLATFRPTLRFALSLPLDRAAILIENSEPMLQQIIDYLRVRSPGIVTLTMAEGTLVVLPAATDELTDAGILPDFAAFGFAEEVGAASLYRPMASPGIDGERTASGIRWLKVKYPSLSCLVPAGQIVAGYPELGPLVGALKELDISVGQAEFVRQIGISELWSAMTPQLLPLHSIVREELISRRLSRAQIIERMVRAVHERSIRLILLRPYELYSVGKLEPFLDDMRQIRDAIATRSYNTGWPDTIPMFGASPAAALGLAIMFLACLWSYVRRYFDCSANITAAEIVAISICAVVLGAGVWKLRVVSKLMGGLATAMLATEAAIWALDRYEKPLHGLLAGLLIVFSGGLVVAAFYGNTNAMLRIAPFSGVKLTLLLPPALILANDLKQRIHPESLLDIVRRPPLWGELFLAGFLLVAAAILTIRSDNASYVPGWEVRFRDILERILWVRPRTKEFLVGYPSLIVYYVAERRGWIQNYREIFRIGASMAFASAVNSFCHLHTLLPLTAIRVANGWFLGILVGFFALVFIDYVGGPIWRGIVELFD